MSDNGDSEATIKGPGGLSASFKGKRTAEFIAIFCLCLMCLLAYVLWEHKAEAKENAANLADVLKAMVSAQREQNCLLSLPADRREKEYFSPNSFCKQISRER